MKQLFHTLLVLAICAWILFSSADSPRSNSDYAYDYIEELFLQDQPEIRKFAAAIVFGLEKPNLTEKRYLIADSLGSWSLSNDNGKSYGKSMTPKDQKMVRRMPRNTMPLTGLGGKQMYMLAVKRSLIF
ncbi:hypothetical protein [Sphingobacterium paludis]|uniref:HEAT repeat protein n=1 Tax=Sphingobacterium paludis TaxID=1476465 RepID=A0A4R7D7Q2_9SPHI|nr:hypothetical protein [Sphingobacterium paludis]TDS17223.1 hypothetical protein B0I21_10185 [Sphingobacterium paludis]